MASAAREVIPDFFARRWVPEADGAVDAGGEEVAGAVVVADDVDGAGV